MVAAAAAAVVVVVTVSVSCCFVKFSVNRFSKVASRHGV